MPVIPPRADLLAYVERPGTVTWPAAWLRAYGADIPATAALVKTDTHSARLLLDATPRPLIQIALHWIIDAQDAMTRILTRRAQDAAQRDLQAAYALRPTNVGTLFVCSFVGPAVITLWFLLGGSV